MYFSVFDYVINSTVCLILTDAVNFLSPSINKKFIKNTFFNRFS